MALKDNLSSNWMKLKKKTKTENKVSKTKKIKGKKEETSKKVVKQITKDLNKNKVVTSQNETEEESNAPRPLPSVKGISVSKQSIGRYVAIDCEFVGVGPDATENALARVSIVNFHGHTVYDKFVKPRERVTDWRTWVSGVTPAHMTDAITFKDAQKEVSDILEGRILVGHAVQHDLDALFLSHPKSLLRDTSKHLPFKKLSKGKTPGLKKLAKEVLQLDIQGAEHSSVEDARATMMLYKSQKDEFEKAYRFNHHR